jgi:hypothetical protein
MQKKLKHSKFRNTGILFELLTKQITADILAGKDNSEAKKLLFKYFKESTELGKEWRLYNFLLNEKVKNESHAERLLSIIVEQRKKLHNNKLAEEKYNLIKEIKELYPIDQFLKASIKNYKVLASTYKIFEDASSKNIKFDVKEVFQAKNTIVENIAGISKKTLTEQEDLIKFYQQQNEDIRLLSYKMLVENLNKKYNFLDDDQKAILREYINNVSNTNCLGEFVCKRIDDVKDKLLEASKKILDSDVIRIKISEVVKQLDKIRPTTNSVVKDNQIMSLLFSYELLKEVRSQLKREEAPNG